MSELLELYNRVSRLEQRLAGIGACHFTYGKA